MCAMLCPAIRIVGGPNKQIREPRHQITQAQADLNSEEMIPSTVHSRTSSLIMAFDRCKMLTTGSTSRTRQSWKHNFIGDARL